MQLTIKYLALTLAFLVLGACQELGQAKIKYLEVDPPSTPEGLSLQAPLTSPGFTATPVIQVRGVRSGDTVKLYSDSNCSNQVASGVASGSTIALTSPALTLGTHTFYARSANEFNLSSACSIESVTYTYAECPVGFIPVPEDPTLGVNNFCIMKYEAKCVGPACPASSASVNAVATSQEAGIPWTNINADNALLACQALGDKYDLISNAEWMSVARNIEQEPANWFDDGGTYKINRGQSDNTPAAACDGLLANVDTDCSTPGYDPKRKRTHILSNNEVLWDFAGNVWEWTDWTVESPPLPARNNFTLGPVTCSDSWEDVQAKITNCAPDLGDPLPGVSLMASPLDTSLSSLHNIGQIRGGTGGGTLRGAGWNDGNNAGIYTLRFDIARSAEIAATGFRCVFRP